jgi:hypothetical protein
MPATPIDRTELINSTIQPALKIARELAGGHNAGSRRRSGSTGSNSDSFYVATSENKRKNPR